MDYLREIKKSGSMEPRKFVLKLWAANHMAIQLSTAPATKPGFTDIQMRCQFLFAMPT
jgi:hypothetical protein